MSDNLWIAAGPGELGHRSGRIFSRPAGALQCARIGHALDCGHHRLGLLVVGCWLLVIPTSLLINLSGVGAAGHIGTGGPLASDLVLPSKVTTDPVLTFCATPALATGATLATAAVTVTEAAALLSDPSLTTNEAT